MIVQVAFSRAARAEFSEAAAWYGAQRQDLGIAFITEIDRCVALAVEQPQLYAVIHKGIRRVVVERFPYSVYFRVEARRIVVLAVFHSSRDPGIWKRRV